MHDDDDFEFLMDGWMLRLGIGMTGLGLGWSWGWDGGMKGCI